MFRVLKEPLLHFLLIGFALFFIYANVNNETGVDDTQIYVTNKDIAKMEKFWIDKTGEAANQEQLQKLIDTFVKEEILFREALAKGLDKGDKTIHKHLAKKMQFVFDNLSVVKEPSVDVLQKFLDKNKAIFIKPSTISFNQIVFTRTKEIKDVDKEANRFLLRLDKSKNPHKSSIGDLVNIDKITATKVFGKDFSNEIFNIETKTWQGPIKSKKATHLVYVHFKKGGNTPNLDNIKKEVKKAWRVQEVKKLNKEFYNNLTKNYNIVITKDKK